MREYLLVLYSSLFIIFSYPAISYADLYDEATVVNVTETHRMVRTNQQECWNEESAAPAPQVQGNEKSYIGPVIGGVAGGLLGSQIGKGTGNTLATVAGAIAGTIIGDHYSNPTNPQGNTSAPTRTERRCRDVPRDTSESDGYDVTYSYAGMTEMVHVQKNPGYSGKIRIRITPLF